jgi:hypothetical protein
MTSRAFFSFSTVHEIVQLPPGCPWADWERPNLSRCEQPRCAWIVTPSNSWSNLAFILAAVMLLVLNRQRDHVRSLHVRELLDRFPAAAVIVGLTSFAYHASYTWFWQFFDFVGSVRRLASRRSRR